MSNQYKIRRDFDGFVFINCPVMPGIKIGSFDCTANCKNNQTPKKDIEKFGFDLPSIICSESSRLPQENQQLNFEI